MHQSGKESTNEGRMRLCFDKGGGGGCGGGGLWRRKPILTPVTLEPHRLNFKRSSAVQDTQSMQSDQFLAVTFDDVQPNTPRVENSCGCELSTAVKRRANQGEKHQCHLLKNLPFINKTLPVFSPPLFFSAVKSSQTSNDGALHSSPFKLQLLYDKFLHRPGSDQSAPNFCDFSGVKLTPS